jgi:beta-N-acetylhexosaminidase
VRADPVRFSRGAVLACLAVALARGAFALDFDAPGEAGPRARAIAAQMSPEEVVGQLFMIAYPGARPDQAFLDSILRRHIGGVKIFGWNAKDNAVLASSIAALQAKAAQGRFGVPLLVATDQEGGWIRHVGGKTSDSPGNMALGASGYPLDAYDSGRIIARELSAMGINMNFAPTVDVASNPKSWVIGSRSFSSDPRVAGILGSAFARGTASERVIATAKHFPGHGDTKLDSHTSLPSIDADWDTLWDRELLPYRMMAADGVPAIMSGHLSFPRAAGSLCPASLSGFFLKEVLRGRIGFRGVVVTDDLCMSGASGYAGGVSRAALMALESGNDIVMFSSADEAAWDLVLEKARSDPAFLERCRDSARRVLELKLEYLRGPGSVSRSPAAADVAARLPDPAAESAYLSQAARAVTYIKKGDLPLPAGPGRVLLAGAFADFFEAGKEHYPQAAVFRFGFQTQAATRPAEAKALAAAAAQADTVIICVANDTSDLLLDSLAGSGKRVVVLSVLSPESVMDCAWPDAIVAAYSYSRASFSAAFSAIRGDIEARGVLPLERRR